MTARLILRSARPDDIAFICAAQQDPEIERFVGSATAAEHLENLRDTNCAYYVCEDADSQPVGYAIFYGLQGPHKSIELQRLAVTRRGVGIGGALLSLIKREVFEELGANRLWLDVFPDNTPARKAYQRAGFAEEGTLREHYFWQGAYRSAIIMSVLCGEYAAGSIGD